MYIHKVGNTSIASWYILQNKSDTCHQTSFHLRLHGEQSQPPPQF